MDTSTTGSYTAKLIDGPLEGKTVATAFLESGDPSTPGAQAWSSRRPATTGPPRSSTGSWRPSSTDRPGHAVHPDHPGGPARAEAVTANPGTASITTVTDAAGPSPRQESSRAPLRAAISPAIRHGTPGTAPEIASAAARAAASAAFDAPCDTTKTPSSPMNATASAVIAPMMPRASTDAAPPSSCRRTRVPRHDAAAGAAPLLTGHPSRRRTRRAARSPRAVPRPRR